MSAVRATAWFGLLFVLFACDSGEQPQNNESQQFYFVESIKIVESAGKQLQSQSLDADALRQIFEKMDNGLKLAFQVKVDFLDRFDPRLSKNYQRYFIKGIETFRLGIEASDAEQQKDGLRLLAQWASFWGESGEEIITKMEIA